MISPLRGLGVVLVVLAGGALLRGGPAAAEDGQRTRDELAALFRAFDRSLSSRVEDAERQTLRNRLGALRRSDLTDESWLDLHVALLALDRRLDAAPAWGLRDGLDNPTIASDDPFDLACIAADLEPVGRARFAWALERVHALPITPEAVFQIGRMARASTARALEAHAAEVGGGATWQEMVERSRDHHPETAEELVTTCQALVDRALADVEKAGLVSLPSTVRGLPVRFSTRATPMPFAFYQPPIRSARDRSLAQLTIPRIPPAFDEDASREWLRDFDVHWLGVVAAHEAVPGHHLQHVRARSIRSRIRAHAFNSSYAEGWAFYAEGLLDRCRPCEDPLDHLAQLRANAWRAARCYIDPALHLGRIRPAEAVEILINEAGFSRRAAESDVRSILRYPARMFGYWVGRRLIHTMHDEYVARNGPGTSREFHDRLLAMGTVPLPLVRAILLEEREVYDARHR